MNELNLELLVERVYLELKGKVPESQIRDVVVELEAEYGDARVQSFLPVIIYRETVRRLSANLAIEGKGIGKYV